MNTKLLLPINLIASILLFFSLTSCGGSQKTSDIALEMDSISTSGEVLMNEDADSPSITISINYTYPKNGHKLTPIFNTLFFGDSLYALLTPEEAADKYIKTRGEQYREEYAGTNIKGHPVDLLNKNIDLSDSIIYVDTLLLSAAVTAYIEDGLTQPTTEVRYFNILRSSGTILLESDLFTEDYHEPLGKLILECLMRDLRVSKPEELEELGFFNIEDLQPNASFFLNDKGITYRFDRLDVVAADNNSRTAFLPYELLIPFLKPDSPIRSYIR